MSFWFMHALICIFGDVRAFLLPWKFGTMRCTNAGSEQDRERQAKEENERKARGRESTEREGGAILWNEKRRVPDDMEALRVIPCGKQG